MSAHARQGKSDAMGVRRTNLKPYCLVDLGHRVGGSVVGTLVGGVGVRRRRRCRLVRLMLLLLELHHGRRRVVVGRHLNKGKLG